MAHLLGSLLSCRLIHVWFAALVNIYSIRMAHVRLNRNEQGVFIIIVENMLCKSVAQSCFFFFILSGKQWSSVVEVFKLVFLEWNTRVNCSKMISKQLIPCQLASPCQFMPGIVPGEKTLTIPKLNLSFQPSRMSNKFRLKDPQNFQDHLPPNSCCWMFYCK